MTPVSIHHLVETRWKLVASPVAGRLRRVSIHHLVETRWKRDLETITGSAEEGFNPPPSRNQVET